MLTAPQPFASTLPGLLEEWSFRAGRLDLRLLRAPSLDPLIGDEPDLEHPPYWPLIWPAAIALARTIATECVVGMMLAQPARRPLECGAGVPPGRADSGTECRKSRLSGSAGPRRKEAPHSKDQTTTPLVLELGCGAGLVGITAAALGARVVQTDYITAALSLAAANARRNGVAGIRRVVADWRRWPLSARFSWIVGSDITYERALHAPLRAVLAAALASGGTALLADPGRPPSIAFFAALERDGWRVALSELESAPEMEPIFLYQVERP